MKKSNKKELNIFCSIAKGRLNEINNLLIPSLKKQNTDYKVILTLINYKADNSITCEHIKTKNLSVNILNPDKPLGFGESHNFAFSKIKPKNFFLIINPDIYMEESALKELLNAFDENVGLVEARQLPFAHPKDLPQEKIFETNWASGCCLLINSTFFKMVDGFDPNYWMYLEDVDLSWKAWINNYKVVQNPQAVVYHYTGLYFKYNRNSYTMEDFWSMRNFLYISYVYFKNPGLRNAKKLIDKTLYPESFIREAYNSFNKLIETKNIDNIVIPKRLKNKIKIYGYNKFSNNPK